ncbi:MAG: single-stranded DNA-binding protein [Prevotellaceae bacterium]|jgi:single-stranded DNA-binding protein|nr:single-stranded DNA-binding protein [Prevotellaceae bacterium]
MQLITIAGRLGSDAEAKEFDESMALTFSVAVVEKSSKGNKETTWYNATIWRKKDSSGAKLADYLKKGTAITISGKPKAQAWLSVASGSAVGRTHITVDNFTLQGSPVNTPAIADKPADSEDA